MMQNYYSFYIYWAKLSNITSPEDLRKIVINAHHLGKDKKNISKLFDLHHSTVRQMMEEIQHHCYSIMESTSSNNHSKAHQGHSQ